MTGVQTCALPIYINGASFTYSILEKRLLKKMIMGMDDYGKKIKKVGFWQVKGKGAVCMWTGSVVVFKKRKREEGGMKRKRHDSKEKKWCSYTMGSEGAH